ncbi:MAG TPA: DUF2911 domain-containing protein [Gemmatimonadaceae bacterium]|nr:DUF2911 domain-containing protein [Gemmatimonadaceae bacterium]
MRYAAVPIALSLITASPTIACAQVRASEHFTLIQRVSSTTITLEGDRPVARGRTLFGDGAVVKWGEVWTPGANWATTIEVDRDVKIDGQPLPKGKYSIWLTPQKEPAAWTLSFSRATRQFHTRHPRAEDEQLHVSVKPEQVGMHMETLAWYLPVVTPEGATLRMHWGPTAVSVQVGVDMPRVVTLPSEQVPMYVGTYASKVTPRTGEPFDVDFVIRDDGGTLKIKALKRDVFGEEVVMFPVTDGRFHVAYASVGTFKGQYFAEPGMIFAFNVADGHARTLEVYGYDDTVVGRGEFKK